MRVEEADFGLRGDCGWQIEISVAAYSEPGSAIEQLFKTFLTWTSISLESDVLFILFIVIFYVTWELLKQDPDTFPQI